MIGAACASAFYAILAASVGVIVSAAVLSLVPALEPLEWLGGLAAGAFVFVYTFRDAIHEGKG